MKQGVHRMVLAAVLVLPFLSIGFRNAAEATTYPDISKMIPDYTIRYDDSDLVTVNKAGSIVIRIANTSSADILQATFDLAAAQKPSTVSNIKVVNASYVVHAPTKITSPVNLYSMPGTIYTFAEQRKGDRGMLNTIAKVDIQGGSFDCNKAVQTEYWIHGIVIDVGSEGSVIKNVEAKNCPLYGNGFVLRANNSAVTISRSHHNDGDGIYLRSCDHCVVQKSWFNYNGINGIDSSDQDGKMAGHVLIWNNSAMWNLDGINLDTTYYAEVRQNWLYGNWIGIAEYHSSSDNLYNSITNNIIKNSPQWGIYEQEYIPWHDPYVSDYSIITGNMMVSNGHENVIKTESMHTMVANNTFVD